MPDLAERMSRHDKALLLRLDLDSRVTANEGDLDTLEDGINELTRAIRWQNRAIASGLVTIIGVLLAAVLVR